MGSLMLLMGVASSLDHVRGDMCRPARLRIMRITRTSFHELFE